MTTADIATWGTAIGTLVLAGVTAYLAWQTKKTADQNRNMVEEVRKEREERERPRVLVYVDYGRLPTLYLVIHNVGGSPASQVSFMSRPRLISPRLEDPEDREEKKVDLLQKANEFGSGGGIKVLPPGAKISLWWGDASDLAKHYEVHPGQDLPFEGKVSYRSLTKERYPREDKLYEDIFVLNPFAVWYLNRPAEGR